MTNKVHWEYQLQAEKYDKRWAKYLNHTHNKAIQFMSPRENDLILDNSGGTGKFCKHLLEIPDTRVVLTDFSEEMLNIAQKRFQTVNNRFEAIHSDAHKLPFDSGVFDKVYNLNSFHFYKNPVAVIEEMFRVCKPGGQILIQDWSSDTLIFRLLDGHPNTLNHLNGEISEMIEITGFREVQIIEKINTLFGTLDLIIATKTNKLIN